MPTFKVKLSRLIEKIGIDISLNDLLDILFKLKAEAEVNGNYLVIEVNPDRLDLMSSIKLAKAIKGILGLELGAPKYDISESDIIIKVNEVPSRPYIVGAVIDGIVIDNDLLEEIIQLQEKLHTSYGRNRRKIAIGLHDLRKLPCNTLVYTETPVSTKMIPLFHKKEMCIKDVIKLTEQGQKYGHISLRGELHPAIFACNDIISLPPVINSDITRLEEGSKGIFIDVTGTDWKAVNDVLNILVTTLADEGGKIKSVKLVGKLNTTVPQLNYLRTKLSPSYVNRVLGTNLSLNEIVLALRKLGHNADISKSLIEVQTPPYRLDILHPIDLIEDVAIGVGYDLIGTEELSIERPKELSKQNKLIKYLRDLLVGHGFIEIHTFTLTDKNILELLGYKRNDYVLLSNPVSKELSAVKNTHLPTLLLVLRKSQHAEFPVKVFEIGYVVVRKNDSPTSWANELKLGIALMNSETSFEELQAPLFSVMKILGFNIRTRPSTNTALIEGRTADVIVNDVVIGFIGEVKPEILVNLGIEYPVVVSEISITKLLSNFVK